MLPSEVLEIPSSDVSILEKYWLEEPWGPWRDNLHAAIIARAALRAGSLKAPLDSFMLKSRSQREAEQQAAGKGLMNLMKTIAVRKQRPKKK